MMNMDDYWHEHMSMYYKWSTWKMSRPLWPRQCNLTGRWLWIKPAMLGTRIITGPGTPVMEYYWVEPEALMLNRLKYGY